MATTSDGESDRPKGSCARLVRLLRIEGHGECPVLSTFFDDARQNFTRDGWLYVGLMTVSPIRSLVVHVRVRFEDDLVILK